MSTRTSFVLMVLFILLGSFALFDPLRLGEKEEQKRERDAHVVWLKDKKLQSISLSGEGKPNITLECAKKEKGCDFDGTGDWIMLKPEQDNADATTVGTLASTVLNLIHHDKIEMPAGFDPVEFGFDKPVAVVELRLLGDSEPLVLKLGKASTVGPNVYLSASSDPHNVFLVPNYLPSMFNKEVFYWRNKRLFPSVEAPAISVMSWKSLKSGSVKADRAADGWVLSRPAEVAANKIMLEGLASTLAYVAAKSVYSPSEAHPDPGKATSGKPDVEIEFSAKTGAHKLKLFIKPPPKPNTSREMLARLDDSRIVYSLEPSQFDRFQKELIEYRQRTLIDDKARTDADELRLNFPRTHQDVVLRRTGKTWAFVPESKSELSQARITAFLDSLRDSPYMGIFPLKGGSKVAAAYLSQTPDLELELKAGGNLILKTKFSIFDRRMAMTESEGEVRTLAESFLKALPVRFEDLSQYSNQTVVVKPEKGSEDGHNH